MADYSKIIKKKTKYCRITIQINTITSLFYKSIKAIESRNPPSNFRFFITTVMLLSISIPHPIFDNLFWDLHNL